MTKLFMSLEIWSDVLHYLLQNISQKLFQKRHQSIGLFILKDRSLHDPNVESQDGCTGLQFNEKVITIIEKS